MADGSDKVYASPRPRSLPAQLPVAGPGTEPASRGTGGSQPEQDGGWGGGLLYVASHVRQCSGACVSVGCFSEIRSDVL
jgi:hypothetical protein